MEKLSAIYTPELNCGSCRQLGILTSIAHCIECETYNKKEEVQIIKLGVGIDGDYCIIKHQDGYLQTVKAKTLKVKEDN